jgi:hypothetical protein
MQPKKKQAVDDDLEAWIRLALEARKADPEPVILEM